MDTRQFHKRCFALLLVCALALGCLPRAQAASRSAIESLQSQQASLTVQKAELQKKLDGIRSSQGQALNKKNLVEQQLNVLKQQIQVSENLLAQYARQITEKEAELEQAKAKEAEYQAEFEQRVRAMEERGNVSYWSVLFQASDFSDLLDRIDMIGEIMDADDQVLDQLAEARQAVAQAKADLEASRQGQQETLAQQQSQQAQLQAQQAEVDQLIQEIATQGDVYAKQIEKLEATSRSPRPRLHTRSSWPPKKQRQKRRQQKKRPRRKLPQSRRPKRPRQPRRKQPSSRSSKAAVLLPPVAPAAAVPPADRAARQRRVLPGSSGPSPAPTGSRLPSAGGPTPSPGGSISTGASTLPRPTARRSWPRRPGWW